MYKKSLLSICLVFSMLCSIPVHAQEENSINNHTINSAKSYTETTHEEAQPMLVEETTTNETYMETEIEPLASTATKDPYESNDTKETAYPYSMIPTRSTAISSSSDLFWLGMKEGGLHSSTDVDWYYIDLKAGQRYFIDLRNVGLTNCYIELHYKSKDGNSYYYTTNPAEENKFTKKPEKYLYITAKETCRYYIKIASGGDWSLSNNNAYLFYVGPATQTFNITNYPIGGASLFGSTYKTVSLDLTGKVVPPKTSIVNLSITDKFSNGKPCTELDKYMKVSLDFAGKKYSNISGTGSDTINNISGVSLGQSWTIGVRCARNLHAGVLWQGYLNGTFECEMAPFPGNEL